MDTLYVLTMIKPIRQISPVKKQLNQCQGRNEVRWRPGQEASLAPPC